MAARIAWAVALLAPAAFLLAFFAFPLWRVFVAAGDGADWHWLVQPYARGRIAMGIWQAVLSVALTLAIAVPLAVLYHRYRIPGARWQLALHAAPFVLPVFVVVYGLREVGLLGHLGPLAAVVVAHAYYNYGFATRLLHAALETRPRHLEDAAALTGAGTWQRWRRVTLPMLAPSLVAVAVLVFLFSLTSFGVVLLLGNNQVWTLETMLYQQLGGAFPNYGRAAVLGLVQQAINAAMLWAYLGLRRVAHPTGARHHEARPAGPGVAVVGWLMLALALAPTLGVLTGGFQVRGHWSLEPWRALLDNGHAAHRVGFDFLAALDRTLTYALLAAIGSLLLSGALAAALRRTGGAGRRFLETAAALPLGTSSVLLGLGFLLAYGPGAAVDLRGSIVQIVIAHTLIAFPFAARVLVPAAAAQDPRMGEAAALLGAGPPRRLWHLHLPLLRGPLIAAGGLAAAISIGDFGASLVLMRPDNMSLAVWVYGHDRPFDPLARAMATALAGVLMVLAGATFLLVERFRPREAQI